VEKTDRLYRNLKDWVMVDELGVQIHLVKEGVVLSDESVSSEKFVHGIKVLMAKNYVDNLSEETRKGMREKARQGLWPTRAPLGYRSVLRADGKRGIEPNPEFAPLVSQVFHWYAAGQGGLTELTERARLAGLVYGRSRKPVPRSRIHALLRNPLYMGEFDWNGKRYLGVHAPLVPRDVWDRAQELLSGRAPRHRQPRRHREFLFSGLIHCGCCAQEGRSFLLVAEIKKERYVYYRCEECKRRQRAEYVREERLVEAFVGALDRVTSENDRCQLAVVLARSGTAGPPVTGAKQDRPGRLVPGDEGIRQVTVHRVTNVCASARESFCGISPSRTHARLLDRKGDRNRMATGVGDQGIDRSCTA